jgi:hypothetical protein
MEPLNDQELHDLLRQWEAPAAPQHLERRIFGEPKRQPWYLWLFTGSIRIPVPALALLLLFAALVTYLLPRGRLMPAPAPRQPLTLADFQPAPDMNPRVIRSLYEKN